MVDTRGERGLLRLGADTAHPVRGVLAARLLSVGLSALGLVAVAYVVQLVPGRPLRAVVAGARTLPGRSRAPSAWSCSGCCSCRCCSSSAKVVAPTSATCSPGLVTVGLVAAAGLVALPGGRRGVPVVAMLLAVAAVNLWVWWRYLHLIGIHRPWPLVVVVPPLLAAIGLQAVALWRLQSPGGSGEPLGEGGPAPVPHRWQVEGVGDVAGGRV